MALYRFPGRPSHVRQPLGNPPRGRPSHLAHVDAPGSGQPRPALGSRNAVTKSGSADEGAPASDDAPGQAAAWRAAALDPSRSTSARTPQPGEVAVDVGEHRDAHALTLKRVAVPGTWPGPAGGARLSGGRRCGN